MDASASNTGGPTWERDLPYGSRLKRGQRGPIFQPVVPLFETAFLFVSALCMLLAGGSWGRVWKELCRELAGTPRALRVGQTRLRV